MMVTGKQPFQLVCCPVYVYHSCELPSVLATLTIVALQSAAVRGLFHSEVRGVSVVKPVHLKFALAGPFGSLLDRTAPGWRIGAMRASIGP